MTGRTSDCRWSSLRLAHLVWIIGKIDPRVSVPSRPPDFSSVAGAEGMRSVPHHPESPRGKREDLGNSRVTRSQARPYVRHGVWDKTTPAQRYRGCWRPGRGRDKNREGAGRSDMGGLAVETAWGLAHPRKGRHGRT
jgi:hypothetical protein